MQDRSENQALNQAGAAVPGDPGARRPQPRGRAEQHDRDRDLDRFQGAAENQRDQTAPHARGG
jgi:hypothetical protein